MAEPKQETVATQTRSLRAEQVQKEEAKEVAAAEERWRRLRPDHAKRAGGYYLSSNGIPVDSEGRVIPKEEWKPEHVAAIEERYPGVPVEKLPLFKAGGSDVYVPDGGKMPGQVQGPPLRGVQPRPEGA